MDPVEGGKRETKGDSLKIMMEFNPVGGGQTGRSLEFMMGQNPVEGKTIRREDLKS